MDRDLRNVLREAMVELEVWTSSVEQTLKKLTEDVSNVRDTIHALKVTLTEMSTLPKTYKEQVWEAILHGPHIVAEK